MDAAFKVGKILARRPAAWRPVGASWRSSHGVATGAPRSSSGSVPARGVLRCNDEAFVVGRHQSA